MCNALGLDGERRIRPARTAGKTKEQLTALLDRAGEVGLLTHLTARITHGYYTIHPALPWYLRQLFARHYDGQAGRSSAEAALRAWVEAMGALGNYYHDQYIDGNRGVIQYLALEEANLLHARRAARRHGWWRPVISAMQGLRSLYEYQGRTAEWARLVAEITPDYCTPDDDPIPGREDHYSLVMDYRVDLARQLRPRPPPAGRLAGEARRLGPPAGRARPGPAARRAPGRRPAQPHPHAGRQRRHPGPNPDGARQPRLRGGLRRNHPVLPAHRRHRRRSHRPLQPRPRLQGDPRHPRPGRRRSRLPAQPGVAAPERCVGASASIKQIGMVHHERFNEARQRGEPAETVLRHAQAAEQHYRQALALCPPSAVADLGPMHHQLGKLYADVGETEPAREHYEQAAQYFEQTGDRYHAGLTRYNMAVMYLRGRRARADPARRRDLLRRAAGLRPGQPARLPALPGPRRRG